MGFLLISALVLIAAGFSIYHRSRVAGPTKEASPTVPAIVPAPQETPTPARFSALSMLPLQFVVLDLETTGLDPERDEIIEFGAILINRDSDAHTTFQALVKPDRRIPRRITKITGITQGMVDSQGDPLSVVLAAFIIFIHDLPLVAFNASFDMGFLQSAARKNGVVIANRYSCALKMARHAWPGLSSYRLTDLAKMGELSNNDTHRALGDCMRAAVIYASAASKLGVAG